MPLLSVSQRSTIEMNLSPFFAVRELYATCVLGLYSFMMVSPLQLHGDRAMVSILTQRVWLSTSQRKNFLGVFPNPLGDALLHCDNCAFYRGGWILGKSD